MYAYILKWDDCSGWICSVDALRYYNYNTYTSNYTVNYTNFLLLLYFILLLYITSYIRHYLFLSYLIIYLFKIYYKYNTHNLLLVTYALYGYVLRFTFNFTHFCWIDVINKSEIPKIKFFFNTTISFPICRDIMKSPV